MKNEQEIHPNTILQGPVDVEGMMAEVSRDFLVRGMFFRRSVDALGADLDDYKDRLDQPTHRYMPFHSYPMADHGRLSFYAAKKLFPRYSDQEALRRFARTDIEDFASSMFGKVMLSMVGDPKKALSLFSSVYEKVAPGPWGIEQRVDGDDYVIHFERHTGDWSYQVGQFEGIVKFYGASATICVTDRSPRVTYRIGVRLSQA